MKRGKKPRIRNKRLRRQLLTAAVFLLSVSVIFPFAVNARVKNAADGRVAAPGEIPEGQYDCALVLGALVYEDGTLSAILEDRVKTGIELYKQGAVRKLLFSGDHGRKEYDEVNAMRRYALEAGVPEEDIFLDHAGFSTYESVYRAQAVFGVESMVIATQGYHLSRALYVADRLGIEAMGADSALQPYSLQKKQDIREFLARNKEFVNCIVMPKPTFLGPLIPIGGDGRATRG